MFNAVHSSPPCDLGTRVEIMETIFTWALNPSHYSLHWLTGRAGTGKSTIAQSMSQRWAKAGQLAATFFCSRQAADRSDGSRVVPTIAYQLAASFPPLKEVIRDVVEQDPMIFTKDISHQFQKLIINPVARNGSDLTGKIVVIDALDECDAKSADELARLILDATKDTHIFLQFLITTRPESDVGRLFKRHDSVTSSMLDDFDVRGDIRRFLTSRFEKIYEDRRDVMLEVMKPWPSNDEMDRLIEASQGLFIYASCAIKFINDPDSSPDDQLKVILDVKRLTTSAASAYSDLDQMYKHVLARCADTDSLRLVLATLISVKKPLPLPVIGILLRDRLTIGKVRSIMRWLRSVVLVPDDQYQPVAIFHASFCDFLVDEARSGKDYYVDTGVYGVNVMNSCLDLLIDPDESTHLLKSLDPRFKDISLEYARGHCLDVANEGAPTDLIFYFFHWAAYTATATVLGTVLSNILRHYIGNTAGTITCVGTVLCSFAVMGILSGCLLCANGGGTLGNLLGQLRTDVFVGVGSGIEGGMKCALPVMALTEGGTIKHTVRSGVAFDLVIIVMTLITLLVTRKKPCLFELWTAVVRIAGVVAGRVTGAVIIILGTDVFGNVPSWIRAIFGSRMTFLVAAGTLFQYISRVNFKFEDLASRYVLTFAILWFQYRCRWMKARYHYALKRRRSMHSITGPLRYPFHVAQFYFQTLKPTHVSATTPTEELFCDWCGTGDWSKFVLESPHGGWLLL